jgi:Flp pilus assembly protein TadD
MLRAQEALHTLMAAGGEARKSAAFHNLLGRTLVLEGDASGGLRELEQAAEAEPSHEEYWIDLAIESAAAGQSHRAGLALEKAKAKSPVNSRVLFAEGICAQLSGHAAEAQNRFQKAADLSFGWEPPYLAQANLLREKGQVTGSVEQLDQAAALFPDSPWPHWLKGLALSTAGTAHSQAAVAYQRALDLAPLQPEVYAALMIGSLQQHDCPAALEMWRRMEPLAMAPDLAPGAACAKASDNALRRYPEWRWIVEIARR